MSGTLKLVVGLGNPGPRYARTRHNAGFRLVERLAGPGARWKDFHGLGEVSEGEGFLLARPMTFMNESGRFLRSFASYRKIAPAEILVCFDDVALPVGRLRLRPGGSSGGQKGMQSIIEHLGTSEIPRLRLGVGPVPPGMDAAAFVLGRFTGPEEALLEDAFKRAAEAVALAAGEGLESAMTRHNAA